MGESEMTIDQSQYSKCPKCGVTMLHSQIKNHDCKLFRQQVQADQKAIKLLRGGSRKKDSDHWCGGSSWNRPIE